MDALELVAGWPVETAAVGVVPIDPTLATGRWRDRVDSVGPVDRAFPWASVTKPATALAVLVAVEEGSLALDEPAGPEGSTVRHLLAHASGLGPDLGPPLARPGTTRIYSNAGYLVLARLLAERAGMPFAALPAGRGARPIGHDRHRSRRRRVVGRSGGGPVRSAGRSVGPGPRAGRAHPDQCGDPRPGRLGAVSRSGRCPSRLPAVRSVRLGPRRGDPRHTSNPIGPVPPTRRPRSAISGGRVRSCGWIPTPVSSAPG